MWEPRLAGHARMKYLGIVEALEADIRSGRVAHGDRVPAQRAVAEALGVDLTTVTRAFNEARRRGLIRAQAGRGTFISETLGGDAADPAQGILDLSMNIPPQPASVDFRRRLPEGIAAVLESPRGLLHLHYQESTGTEPARRAAARWLAPRIEGVTAERTVVTAGAQSALFAICNLLLGRGDALAAGAMTYPGLKAVAVQQGLAIEPLEMDAHGIVPDAFDKACRERGVRALYVVPSIDNPTTATLPEERRRALAALARRHGVAIIEDDPYAPLRAERTVTLAELAPDITWHIATLSKCATLALRVAFVAAPSPSAALRLAGVLRATVLMVPPLLSALASRWIADGSLDAMTQAVRAENWERQKLASSILHGRRFAADPHGHHLWLHLPAPWRAADFAERAGHAGVAVVPGSAFATLARSAEAVRISLGVAPDRAALKDGLTLLAELMAQPVPEAKAVV